VKRHLPRLSYANVMSTIAVFLVLGGASALAAGQLGKNSVGSKQIKKNAITTAKIKDGAVTSAKIQLSGLGTVPSATRATSAGTADNASALGSLPAASYEQGSNLLSAVVTNNGSAAAVVRGTAGTTAERVASGDVFVKFPRNITNCTWVASAGNPGATSLGAGIAGARGANNGDPNTVQVITWNVSGAQTDLGFHLIVLC
jgi:hypothetical protein